MTLSRFAARHAARQPGYRSGPPIVTLNGLNEDDNPQALRPGDLRRAFNCARKGSMLGTRPGVTNGEGSAWNAAPAAAPIVGMHEFVRAASGTRTLVVVVEGKAYENDTTVIDITTDSITISDDDSTIWTFAIFQDKLFAAGGADGDSFWCWDGSGQADKISLVNSAAAAMDVKFVFAKWNMLFVCGMNGTLFDDNPLAARYCDYASDATDPTNWKSANVIPGQLLGENFGVGSFSDEVATGFSEYTDNRGDFLLMLTNKRIISFLPNPNVSSNADAFILSDTISSGCVAQDAFVSLGTDIGDTVYVSRDGIHSLAQSQQYGNRDKQFLSYPIRKTFDSLNFGRLSKISGAYWPTEGVILFSVATGANTTNDTVLCLDIQGSQRLTPETVRWYKWTLNGLTPSRIAPFRASDGKPYPYVGCTNGRLVRFDRAVYADDATGGISVEFQLRDDDFGIPSREKNIGDAFISLQGLGDYSITHSVMVDDGNRSIQTSSLEVPNTGSKWGTMAWGTAVWGDDTSIKRHRVPGIGSSPTIGHRFSHMGIEEPFWLGQIDQQYMISGPADDAEANQVGG